MANEPTERILKARTNTVQDAQNKIAEITPNPKLLNRSFYFSSIPI